MRGVLFYLIALFYLRQTYKILKNKNRWTSIMNKLLVLMLLVFVVTGGYCILLVMKKKLSEVTLCNSYIDVVIQSDISFVLIVFTFLGAYISRRIYE